LIVVPVTVKDILGVYLLHKVAHCVA